MKLPLELLYDIVFYLDFFKRVYLFPKLGLKKFDINKAITKNRFFYIIGKRATGKSFLIKDIIYHKTKQLKNVVQYEDFDTKLDEKEKIIVLENHYTINKQRTKHLLINHRHYNTSVIVSLQVFTWIHPSSRGNAEYIFIHKNNNDDDLKKIYNNYLSGIIIYSEFKILCDIYTKNYNVVVIDL